MSTRKKLNPTNKQIEEVVYPWVDGCVASWLVNHPSIVFADHTFWKYREHARAVVMRHLKGLPRFTPELKKQDVYELDEMIPLRAYKLFKNILREQKA